MQTVRIQKNFCLKLVWSYVSHVYVNLYSMTMKPVSLACINLPLEIYLETLILYGFNPR